VVYPRTGPRYPTPPLTAIEQVLIDDQLAPQALDGATIRVPPGRGRFSIKYAGLSFIAPQSVRYQYMLEGFEKNWVDAGVRRTAFYTNVPPGKYRFLVRAANSDGLWSLAPAAQAFVVQPYFYQTIWFYALLAAALAALGYFIYRWRVLTVEAQYRAVIEERSRIAREIHDTLAQGYVAIAVQLELAEHLICVSAESAAQQLKQTKEMVREGLAEARSSIWNLRAQSDAQTLPSLLATYVAAAARRHAAGPVIKFAVHGAYRPLERGVEKELERIAQQAVANAIAHAKARSVVITLNYDSQWLDLRVADDGIGMAAGAGTQEKRGHFGIRGMRERAEGIGAVLQVESTPGRGVIITVRIDFEKARGKETH
jgi:signal transduction histidine kinase